MSNNKLKPEVMLDKFLRSLGVGLGKWKNSDHNLWHKFSSWFDREIRK